MTSDKKNHSIEELIKKVSTYLSDPNDLQDIRKAYEYANDAHKDQIRKNGDPVSYTHLDVYKRQVVVGILICSKSFTSSF